MARKMNLSLVFALIMAVAVVLPSFAAKGGRAGSELVIYVESQGLYYDSIVGPDLPQHGPFQKLEVTASGLQTEFGPGDQGYVGGRWWLDANQNDLMDEGDLFFSCPLLGPGRTMP